MAKLIVSICIMFTITAIGLYTWTFTENFTNFKPSEKHEIWSEFGEYLGGVLSPIFSFGALIALLYTIKLQSKELALSTEQLEKSAQALEAQNIVLQKQNFETTFFHLLKLFSDTVKDLSIKPIGYSKELKAIKVLNYMYDVLESIYEKQLKIGNLNHFTRIEIIEFIYDEFYYENQNYISQYFVTIYNTLKFISDSKNTTDDEKHKYTDFLKAQLSKQELALIFYYALSQHGIKLRPLVVKFNIFESIKNDPSILLENDSVDLLQLKL